MNEKNCQTRMLYPEIITFQNEGEIKDILREGKLMEFVSSRPTLKEIPKEILQAEGKDYEEETWMFGSEEKNNRNG